MRKYKRLRYEDKKHLEEILKSGAGIKEASEILGVHRDTVYKELKRCGATKETYNAEMAQKCL